MASITIRNLDNELKDRLRVRAAEHRRSMEEEVRCILREVLSLRPVQNMADLALEIFGPKAGVELDLPPRVKPRDPPHFD